MCKEKSNGSFGDKNMIIKIKMVNGLNVRMVMAE